MKLSKQQVAAHEEAEGYLRQDVLKHSERLFVFEHWQEGATNVNSKIGAFFTPYDLAVDFSMEITHNCIIDLCAGIGVLSFVAYHHMGFTDITCVEYNPQYYEIGKKLLPEANWIHGNIFDPKLVDGLSRLAFDQAISNPPFGKIKTGGKCDFLKYTGSEFEFRAIEVAARISRKGTFILPQMSTPYKYSGEHGMSTNESRKYDKFSKQTGLEFEFNAGLDTSVHINDWKGVAPMCEIINCDFEDYKTPDTEKEQLTFFN